VQQFRNLNIWHNPGSLDIKPMRAIPEKAFIQLEPVYNKKMKPLSNNS